MHQEHREKCIERQLNTLWQGGGRATRALLRLLCGLNQLINAIAFPLMRGGAKGLQQGQDAALQLEWMRNAGRGFDAAGMLAEQAAFAPGEGERALPFGKGTVEAHGCGWMAAYNALRILGETPAPAELLREMERGGLLLGKSGTNPYYLCACFRRRGYRAQLYTSREEVHRALEDCAAGIWLYVFYEQGRGQLGAHYVALAPAENGRLRHYNGGAGWPEGTLLPEQLPCGIGRALIAIYEREGRA